MKTDALVTTSAAAKFLSVSKAFLERDRWQGATIPYVKVGSRAVRYRLTDLEAFVSSRLSCAPSDAVSTTGAPTA